MPIVGGWHMPEADKYFQKFIPQDGPLPKMNGFQKSHLAVALDHCSRWEVALDIGAHVGFWTRDLAAKFGHVFAFEPAPDTYECLVKNTDDLENVSTTNAGVGAEYGVCRMRLDPKREAQGNTGSRFIAPGRGDTLMMTIDGLKLPECDFMKIDVEGFEFRVLEGAQKTILKHKPTIIMECDKRFAGRFDIPNGAAEQLLISLGYQEVAHMRPDKVFIPK